MLKSLSTYLRRLQRLSLWGCNRITKAGLFDVLQEAEMLGDLSVDALPHSVRLTDTSLVELTASGYA